MPRRRRYRPTDLKQALTRRRVGRLPPSQSSVRALHRQTTTCYAYLCPYAYGCAEKSARPAQVFERRCMRYQPETMRVEPRFSEHALDVLARQRKAGVALAPATLSMLDRFRPNGPLRTGA